MHAPAGQTWWHSRWPQPWTRPSQLYHGDTASRPCTHPLGGLGGFVDSPRNGHAQACCIMLKHQVDHARTRWADLVA